MSVASSERETVKLVADRAISRDLAVLDRVNEALELSGADDYNELRSMVEDLARFLEAIRL